MGSDLRDDGLIYRASAGFSSSIEGGADIGKSIQAVSNGLWPGLSDIGPRPGVVSANQKHPLTADITILCARSPRARGGERYLTLAFEEACRLGVRPVPVEIADSVLCRQIDDLEPTLTRHDYDVRTLADPFNVKRIEIKAFLARTLPAERTRELTEAMKAAGVRVSSSVDSITSEWVGLSCRKREHERMSASAPR
jgi:hypothetical protein